MNDLQKFLDFIELNKTRSYVMHIPEGTMIEIDAGHSNMAFIFDMSSEYVGAIPRSAKPLARIVLNSPAVLLA